MCIDENAVVENRIIDQLNVMELYDVKTIKVLDFLDIALMAGSEEKLKTSQNA